MKKYDLGGKWRRVSMIDSIKEACGVDFNTIETDEEAVAVAKEKHIEIPSGKETRGHIISLFFDEYVEATLIQPTFIYDYPVEISPLAKKCPNNFIDVVDETMSEMILNEKQNITFADLTRNLNRITHYKKQIGFNCD